MNDTPGTAMARASSIEDSALGTTSEFSTELAPTAAAEAARQEIQAAVILAKRFPRNEDEAYAKIIKSCKRPTFAGDAEYSFPRGKVQDAKGHWVPNLITGPSIYIAREFARVWGNIRHGCDVIVDSEEARTIRAWAWDLETNVKVTADASFMKLIYRKQGGWVKPDERDLRELTNKHAALAKRNCLLELLPSDMVEDACKEAQKTLNNEAATDPDAARKALITAFAGINVPVTGLEKYLGHPLAECSPEELANLRTIYKSIKDGNSTWNEYVNGGGDTSAMADKTKEKAEKLRDKVTPKSEPEPEVIEAEPVLDAPDFVDASALEPPADPDPIDPEESTLENLIVLAKDTLKGITKGNARRTTEILNGRRIDSMDLKQVKAFIDELAKLDA